MSCALESRRTRRTALVAGVGIATILGGCGQRDLEPSPPRPPVAVQIAGVITPEQVTVSPRRIGGGRIVLTVSNQDEDSHTVMLEGGRTREQVGPINPQDTATITAEVRQGSYAVRAGSERAVNPSERIEPARLLVGRGRPTEAGPAAAVGSVGVHDVRCSGRSATLDTIRELRTAERQVTQRKAWPRST